MATEPQPSRAGPPAPEDEDCPPWALELRQQLDALQQGTILAQQEARGAREDCKRSEQLLLELQRRVEGMRAAPAAAPAGIGSTMADLSSGLVGSMGSLLGGGAKSGLAGGCAGNPMGGSSAASYNGGAAHDGASMQLGALHASMDAHFKQMEELWREVTSTREEVDARVKETRREQMTQHKKLSARLNALEAAHEARRSGGGGGGRGGAAAAPSSADGADDSSAQQQAQAPAQAQADAAAAAERYEELKACIEALTMQLSEAKQRVGKLNGRVDMQQELLQQQQRLHEQRQEAAEAAVAEAAREGGGASPRAARAGHSSSLLSRPSVCGTAEGEESPRWLQEAEAHVSQPPPAPGCGTAVAATSAADAAAGAASAAAAVAAAEGAAGAVSELREEQRVIAEWLSGAAAKLDTLEETSASQAAALSEARAQLQAVGGRAEAMDELLGANDLAGMRHRVAMLQKHVESQLSLMSELRGEVGAAQRSADGLTGELRERLPQIKAEVDDVASARLPGLQRQLLTIGDSINAMWEVINGIVLQRDQDGYGGGGSGGGGGGGYPRFGSVAEEDEGRGGGGEVYFP